MDYLIISIICGSLSFVVSVRFLTPIVKKIIEDPQNYLVKNIPAKLVALLQ